MANGVKYKHFYQLMMEQNKDAFAEFKSIHDAFMLDPEKHRAKFNEVGLPLVDIIRDWERKLCHGMEKGKYANYSARLAEQFWNEVRKTFPKIDEVGIEG